MAISLDAPSQGLSEETAAARPLGGFGKRAVDILVALGALAASAIVFLAIAAALRLSGPGPVFYTHRRIGFQGRPFNCIKFRTMVVDADAALESHLERDRDAWLEWQRDRKLRDDPRVLPRIGHFLRRTSLDELPQLINVLRGDMSIVGPRPVTPSEVELYGDAKGHYLTTRPGITGLWQVSGRSSLAFDERIRIDSHYVSAWSPLRDFRIMLSTIVIVLLRKDAY